MSDRSGDPESGAGEPKPPKIKAEDNPWYLLATLYGEPGLNLELKEENRRIWNHCLASFLDVHEHDVLIRNGNILRLNWNLSSPFGGKRNWVKL